MNERKNLVGVYRQGMGPLGYLKTEDGGIYYISYFDPLAGKLVVGQYAKFTGHNPADHRNCAKDIQLLSQAQTEEFLARESPKPESIPLQEQSKTAVIRRRVNEEN